MSFLPIVRRELRVAARKPRTYWVRLSTAAVAILLLGATVLFSRIGARWTSADVFQLLAWYCFVYSLLGGALAAADALSSEKRDDTLGLLFLTDLRGYDVALGKLTASSLGCFFGLGAMLPVLAVPILMGGIQTSAFARVVLALASTLLLSLVTGLLVSVASRNAFRATGFAVLLMLGAGFLLPLFALWLEHYWKLGNAAMLTRLFCPLWTMDWAMSSGSWRVRNDYGWSVLVLQLCAAGLLVLTCWITSRIWRESQDRSWWSWLRTCPTRLQAWTFGRGQARRDFRQRMLQRNPFAWLACRQLVSSPGLLIAMFTVLSVAYLVTFGPNETIIVTKADEACAVWFLTAAFLHILLLVRVSSVASQRFGEDRQSGALELVLGTSLRVRTIVLGQWRALFRQLFAPGLLVVSAHACFLVQLLGIFSTQHMSVGPAELFISSIRFLFGTRQIGGWDESLPIMCVFAAGVILFVHWLTLGWVGMWLALRMRHPRYAPWAALGVVLVPPVVLFIAGLVAMLEYEAVWPEWRWILFCIRLAACLPLLTDVFLSGWAAIQLRKHFRTAVTEGFDLAPAKLARMRWRRVRLGLALPAAAALLLMLFHWEENTRGQRAWQRLLQDMARRGENLQMTKTLPEGVPPEQNFARAPIVSELFGLPLSPLAPPKKTGQILITDVSLGLRRTPRGYVSWNEQGSWQHQRTNDLARWRSQYQAFGLIPTNSPPRAVAADILLAFSCFDGPLDELLAASERPFCRFPDLDVLWRRNEHLCNVIELLSFRASARLIEHDVEGAFSDAKLCVLLASLGKGDFDLLGASLQPLWEGLVKGSWQKTQLSWFQNRLAAIDLLTEYSQASRRGMLNEIAAWERHRAERKKGLWRLTRIFSPIGWTYHRQIAIYQLYQNQLKGVVNVGNRYVAYGRLNQAYRAAVENLNVPRGDWPQGFYLAWQVARIQNAINLALIACALERYRMDRQEYPQELKQLEAEGYLERLPPDPVNGAPTHYRRNSPSSFVLYSVGGNEKDDGGNSRGQLDWVWKYPEK